MGIFSEIKKLIFGVQSVGKSAVDKGMSSAQKAGEDVLEKSKTIGDDLMDKGRDFGDDLMEKGKDFGDDLMEKGKDLGENILEKTSGLREAILHQAEGTINMVSKSETLKKAAVTTERIGEKVFETGEDLISKGSDFASNVGEKVIQKGSKLVDKGGDLAESIGEKILGKDQENVEKAKEFTETVGSKVLAAKKNIVEKAKDVMEDINEKIDETVVKAKDFEAKEAIKAAKPQKPLHEILDENKGSLVDHNDDFFEKAEKFAKGDYEGVLEGQVTVQKTGVPVKKEPSKAAGFTDLDGDGNEIIDDAIVDTSEDEEEKGKDTA